MRAFIAGVVAAVIIAVISVYALNGMQKPVTSAYSSPTGVRI